MEKIATPTYELGKWHPAEKGSKDKISLQRLSGGKKASYGAAGRSQESGAPNLER